MRTFYFLLSFLTISAFKGQEKHLKNIQKLTFGGDNAEAYFSPNSEELILQSNNKQWGVECDQIFRMTIAEAVKDTAYRPKIVSTGKGRTTCSYFMPDGKDFLYASTHLKHDSCPPPPKIETGKYLWPIYPEYDIFLAAENGTIKKQLTNAKGYDAEATVSPKGDKIVFTSDRSGDLELWIMDIDGSNQKQITNTLGYDGGAFFSPDGKKLVFRASRPNSEEEIKEYKFYLSHHLVAPTNMEIFTCNIDGSDMKQITKLGKANWAPFFHPSGKKIIFSSNHQSKKGYDFQLFMIDINGKKLEQITSESIFNAFPMFSPNGKKLVWSSNRNNHGTRDTNLFIADWVD
ncbi:MAG: TolB family protein [Bacteroidia bacterium]